MKVKGQLTNNIDIDVPEWEVKRIVIEILKEAMGLPNQYELVRNTNGKLELHRYWEEHTSHSWIESEKIRKATKSDLAADLVLKHVEEYFRNKHE